MNKTENEIRYRIFPRIPFGFVKRGEKLKISFTVVNLSNNTWFDTKSWKHAPHDTKLVGPFINHKKFIRDFRIQYGFGDKTDKSFYKPRILRLFGKNLIPSGPVNPHEKVLISFSVEPKKFASSGWHKFPLQIGNYKELNPFTQLRSRNLYFYVLPNRKSFFAFWRAIKLYLIKPGKTSGIFENDAARNTKQLKPVIMCTWKRLDNLELTIQALKNQENAKVHLYIWNNNRTLENDLINIVKNTDLPITVYKSVNNIGGFGRFYLAKTLNKTNDFVLFIDDDLNLHKNAVSNFFAEATEHTVKSQWAFRFNDINNYWDKTHLKHGEKADYCGTGGMIVPTEIFNYPEIFECPRRYWFVEDLWLSYVADSMLGWNLLRSSVDLEIYDDGKDQTQRLIDNKIWMLKYLTSKKKWLIDRKWNKS